MPDRPFTRLAAMSGVAFAVLLTGALFAPGPPPKADDSAAKIADLLADKRGVILAGMYVAGLALICGLWFFATVGTWLDRGAHERDRALVRAAVGGAVVATVFLLVGMLFFYGATFEVAGDGQLAMVRGLTDAGNATIEMSKFGLALFVGGVSVAALPSNLLPRWLTTAGLAVAAIAVGTAIPLFAEGSFTQFGGGLDLVGAGPALAWILVLGTLMTLRARPAR
jgi:hypothetical protein